MEQEGIVKKSAFEFTKKSEVIQTIIIGLIALIVPTFLGGWRQAIFGKGSVIASNSQLIVGSIVNTALIMTAINLKGWTKNLLVVTMPSISTILGGYVFGTSSIFMAYMIPAIWIGNFALVYSYKLIMIAKKKNYFLAGVVGIIVKVAVIFGVFSILKAFGIFPEKVVGTLQQAMSLTQLITATIGMLISFAIFKGEEKAKSRK